VRSDQVFVAPIPQAGNLLETTLGDVLPYPYGPYREIDWIEIPAERCSVALGLLAAVGQFPIRQVHSGLRVIGYTW